MPSLADDHGVLPLVATRLRAPDAASHVPASIRQKLADRQRTQILFTLSMVAEMFRVLGRFASASIPVLAIKGPALAARCYNDPALRQYGDLDLVVRDRDIRRSTELMIALGYEPNVPLAAISAAKIPGEYVFVRSNLRLLVEFHTERTFRYHPKPLPLESVFGRQIDIQVDARRVPAFSTEDELILISIHAAKHFWERLMWVADVAALVSRQPLDWPRVAAASQEVGAERMLRVALQLAKNIFGIELPAEVLRDIDSDPAAASICRRIEQRLPAGESSPLSLFQRATFRMRMRGGLLAGAAYLTRLSLSPTEEDWASRSDAKRSWLLDAASRPFRLARKYRRDGKP